MKNKLIFTFAILLFVSFDLRAQTALTAADYARAESMLGFNTAQYVDRSGVRPNWLPDGRFWYQILTPEGKEFIIINPSDGSRTVVGNMNELSRMVTIKGGFGAPIPNQIISPDGTKAAFIRDWNLWMRDTKTNKETQLTTDGVENFGYATDNAGWTHSDRAVLEWSPDSKKIATFQQDQRKTGDMYLVSTNVGHPKLESWKYPLPGDKDITMIERVIVEVDNPKVIRLKMPQDEHRTTLCDDISCDGGFTDVEWSADAAKLAFVSTSRDHKEAKLKVADANTGEVKEIFTETVETQYESGQGAVNWRFLPASNEFVWYSEKDDWGHLYLYDLTTGKLKNQITKGDFVVTQLVKVDEKNRVLYFNANGREPNEDPYFSHFYRVDFDGKNLKSLTPEPGNHQLAISDDNKYFVDNFSQPDIPTTAVLRDMSGKMIAALEKADVSRLTKMGWKPPTQIKVKSRDGKWDLYGLMFTPSNLDPSKKYPVIDYIYPGPQGGGVGGRSFTVQRGDHQALAELGFVVMVVDGTCNPDRSKSFHDACYGNMADNTLLDQIAAVKQLAEKYPYIDAEKVGIWGHSGGGFATAAAMLRYPDFFKVGISESGNHDNRNYEDDWGERYIGLLKGTVEGQSNYAEQANQMYAKNLKGKLLIAHGGMDDNVPPYNSYLVVQELIKANKDFDLIVFPNAHHGYGEASFYMMRRRWDYFVKNLLGADAPKEYEIKLPKQDPRLKQ